MLGSERRVVITGLGLVTPLGDSPERSLDVAVRRSRHGAFAGGVFGWRGCPMTSGPRSVIST